MTSNLAFASNSLSIFLYEPFSYRWAYPSGTASGVVTTSTFLGGSITEDTSGVTFASGASGYNLTSSFETIVIQAYDSGSNLLGVSSNIVTVSGGRFVDDVSASLSGRRFAFYRNEPVTPTVFSAAFPLSGAPLPAIGSSSLPAGLSFVSNAPNRYTLQGTPVLQTPSNTYTFIGSNTTTSKQASAQVNLAVNAERMILDPSGVGVVDQMIVGVPITPQSLTARCPPYPRQSPNLCNIQYTWTALPIGLEFANSSGIPQSSPFTPLDASATLILQGTPTLAGAKQFANLNISQAAVGVTATRIGSTSVTASKQFLTSFAETVLFDDIPAFKFYKDVSLSSGSNFVRAQTYFATLPVPITSITAPFGLPPGLTLIFDSSQSRAELSGTPTTIGTASYTFRASNANGTTQDTAGTIAVVADSVAITGPVDVSYSFILSRPASSAFAGYYPSPIAWTATAASSQAVSFSAPALAGTGLSLSVSGNTATLAGIPDTVTSLQNLQITATAALTGASSSRDVSFAILDDVFTFASVPAQTLIQNKPMTPVRITATTLSERAIVYYSATGLPNGIAISPDGLITGTPTLASGGPVTATFTASTGYASATFNLAFTVLLDDVLIASVNGIDPVNETFSGIDIRAISYSGNPALLSLDLSGLIPYQGSPKITLNITPQGILSGDFTTAHRPFPAYSVPIQASVGGNIVSSERLFFSLSNTPIPYHLALVESNVSVPVNVPYTPPFSRFQTWVNATYAYKAVGASNTAQFDSTFANFVDFSPSNSNVSYYGDIGRSSNSVILGAGSNLYRSTNGGLSWTQVSNITTPITLQGPTITIPNPPGPPTTYSFPSPLVLCLASDGGSNWTALCAGSTTASGSPVTIVRRSVDDGISWTDTSLALFTRTPTSPVLDPAAANTRLFYNNGRYFLTQTYTASSNDAVYYADAGSVTSPWVSSAIMSSGTGLCMAFSNNTAIVGGEDDVWNLYSSSNNGTSWSQVVDARFNGASPVVSAAGYGDGNFVIAVNDFGLMTNDAWLYRSSNATTWIREGPVASPSTSNVGLVYDDNAWLVANTASGQWSVDRFQTDLSDSAAISVPMPDGYPTKRLLFQPVSRGAVSGTAQIVRPPFANLIEFVSPTQSAYTFWQFCAIDPIVGQVSQTTPKFVYYYASGLPDGFTTAVDGSAITIGGKSVTYNDANQRLALFARQGTDTLSYSALYRTILPTISRTQSNASAYTSYVRQYTAVNAARTAENATAYPSEVTTIGEFTRPTPPSEITANVDPKCYSTSNCP